MKKAYVNLNGIIVGDIPLKLSSDGRQVVIGDVEETGVDMRHSCSPADMHSIGDRYHEMAEQAAEIIRKREADALPLLDRALGDVA